MSNILNKSNLISKLSLANFYDEFPYLHTANRRFKSDFMNSTYQSGDVINIRTRNQFGSRRGPIAPDEVVEETTTPLQMVQFGSNLISYDSIDWTLTVRELNARYIKPAMMEVISDIETYISGIINERIYYTVGTPGAPISTYQQIADTTAKMRTLMMPTGEAYIAYNPTDEAKLKGSLQNSFNPMLNKGISERGALGRLDIFDMHTSALLKRQIAGDFSGAPVILTTTSSGNAVPMTGFTAGAGTVVANAGDSFQVADVFAVTPYKNIVTADIMDFVVTADAEVDGGGNATIFVEPAIRSDPSDPRQNVSVPLASTSVVTFRSSHNVNYAYTREALDFVSVPLSIEARQFATIDTDASKGCSVRTWFDSDIRNDKAGFRIDILGAAQAHGLYGVRLIS